MLGPRGAASRAGWGTCDTPELSTLSTVDKERITLQVLGSGVVFGRTEALKSPG